MKMIFTKKVKHFVIESNLDELSQEFHMTNQDFDVYELNSHLYKFESRNSLGVGMMKSKVGIFSQPIAIFANITTLGDSKLDIVLSTKPRLDIIFLLMARFTRWAHVAMAHSMAGAITRLAR